MRPDPTARARERRRTTWLLALAAALHGLVYLALLPPWMGEDEPWHFEYVRHVATGHVPWGGPPIHGPRSAEGDERARVPLAQLQVRRRFQGLPESEIAETQREILASMARERFYARVDWVGIEEPEDSFDQVAPDFSAAAQPPLYYLLAGAWLAPWLALAPEIGIERELFLVRAFSFALYVATCVACLLFARHAFDDERLAICAALFCAWLPMHARQAALVNNDVLARTLVAFVFWLCARQIAGRARAWELALAVLLCALGLLAKTTAAGGLALLVLALPFRSKALALRGRSVALAALVALVVAIAALGVWLWLGQHNPALPKNVEALRLRLSRGLSLESLAEIWRTFVGSFNWYSRDLPRGVSAALGTLAALAALAALATLVRTPSGLSRRLALLCFAAVAIQLALVALRGVAHGRYLMPVLPALGVLAAAGLVALPERWRTRAVFAFALALALYDAVFLWAGLVPNEVLLWSA